MRWALVAALAACAPAEEADVTRVAEARVLAVAAEPAEVAPGETFTLRSLVADRSGTAREPRLRWSLCTARRPLSELAPVSPRCLADAGDALRAAGEGATASAAMPADACQLFGPEPPDSAQGESARPVDPDVTGGYSFPVRARLDGAATFFFERLRCGLAGATREQSAGWSRRYRRNENPAIEAVERADGGAAIEEGATVAVAPGARLALRVRWALCEPSARCGDGVCGVDEDAAACAADCATPRGCAGAERYLAFDPVTRELAVRREAMRVSWFATDGRYAEPRTGRGRDDATPASDNAWTAPAAEGEVHLWAVLRDDRGGAAWRSWRVRVAR